MLKNIKNNTICACATPPGSGAISVIRISGPDAVSIVSKIFKSKKTPNISVLQGYSACLGTIMNKKETIDEVIITVFKAPSSYTGEDEVEISCHGSHYIVQKILELLIDQGAKFAEPGEFTKRAFLNGKMDLAQAEAVADLISSETEASHRVAMQQMRGGFSKDLMSMREKLLELVSLMELELDFSDEDVEFADRKQLSKLLSKTTQHISDLISSFKLGNAIKNGVPVAIVGATNTGKSTLLNALVGEERAIVSSIHGTTRDTIEDTVNLDGVLFRFIDTAGIRNTLETIEMIGIERTYFKIKQASIVIMMLDAERPEVFAESIFNLSKKLNSTSQSLIILLNKCDNIIGVKKFEAILDQIKDGADSIEKLNEIPKIAKEITALERAVKENALSPIAIIPVAAKKEIGLDILKNVIVESQKKLKVNPDTVLVTNFRHYSALKDAYAALLRVSVAIDEHTPTDLLAQDIRESLYHIGSIVGEISTDEILGNIFKNFCIGK